MIITRTFIIFCFFTLLFNLGHAFTIPKLTRITSTTHSTTLLPMKRTRIPQPEPRPGSMKAAIQETGRVPYGEDSRQYRRTVFRNPDDWRKHRASDRLGLQFRGIFVSGVVRCLRRNVLSVVGVATFVVGWNGVMKGFVGVVPGSKLFKGIVASMEAQNVMLLRLPLNLFSLSASSLGLLLVFRTNSSYQRWLEARANLSKITSHLRNIVRQSCVWGYYTISRSEVERLGLQCWIFMRAVQIHLRDPHQEYEAFERDVRLVFSKEEAFQILSLVGKEKLMTWMLLKLSKQINILPLDGAEKREIDKSMVIMGDCISACHTIYHSPVPLVYTRHAGRFLYVWLLGLPFALYDSFVNSWNHLALIPACALISMFLLGIDELAIQLEEPFSILPIEYYCDLVRNVAKTSLQWLDTEDSAVASGLNSVMQ